MDTFLVSITDIKYLFNKDCYILTSIFCTQYDFSLCFNPTEAKTWREIYKEVRQEEEIRDPTPPPPIKRSLEGDFDSIENSTLSRSSLNRSSRSPRGRVSPGRDRISPERDRVSLERDSGSLDRSRLSVDRSRDLPERDQSFKESSRISQQETPERLMSGAERQSRSRIKRSPPSQPVPPLALG